MIVVAVFLLMAVSIGITVNCFNPISVALVKDFGSASGVQVVFMIAALANLIGSALFGKIVSLFSLRIVMPVAAVILSAGIFMWSFCTSLTMLYVVAVFVGLGASGVALVPCGALINNWFEEKKGLAIGIGFSGSVIGGLILVQLVRLILESMDWQAAYMVLGIIAAVVAIPTTIFIVREHPNDKGLVPLGAKAAEGLDQARLKGITLKKFIKTPSFWLLAISVFLMTFINTGMHNNVSIYLTSEVGYEEGMATNIFTLILFAGVFGKILLGALFDKKGVQFGMVTCMAAYIIAVVFFLYSGNLILAIAFAIVFGLIPNAMATVAPPYVTAKIVGVKEYATIFGILNLFYGIGLVTGPVVAAVIFDSMGSYAIAWILFAALSVVLSLAAIIAHRKGKEFSNLE